MILARTPLASVGPEAAAAQGQQPFAGADCLVRRRRSPGLSVIPSLGLAQGGSLLLQGLLRSYAESWAVLVPFSL